MTIKKEKKGDLTIYHVDKLITDDKMETLKNTNVKPSQIELIINDDADVYTEDGKLLLRFRKNKLTINKINDFYDNIIKFAQTKTNNRGSTSGSKKKNIWNNPKIMTNIIGYFDTFSPKQKYLLKQQGKQILNVRETRFNMDNPEKFKKMVPLIKEIDEYYEQYIPDNYVKQKKKANQTPFKISNTSFTTITTNVNFQTTIHKDKGDDSEGFGNLAVIEKGRYSGGETCLPQYGIGVNVRTGDILYMDVHEWHGNLPIKLLDKNAIRLSIVCYLRYNIWEKTKHKTKKFMIKHNKTIKNLRKKDV
jgi:hypothetical protein